MRCVLKNNGHNLEKVHVRHKARLAGSIMKIDVSFYRLPTVSLNMVKQPNVSDGGRSRVNHNSGLLLLIFLTGIYEEHHWSNVAQTEQVTLIFAVSNQSTCSPRAIKSAAGYMPRRLKPHSLCFGFTLINAYDRLSYRAPRYGTAPTAPLRH